MKHKLLYAVAFGVLLGMLPFAVASEEEQAQMSPKALEISNNLNCPVCEGQSVRDSNAQLARDMRRTVQEMVDDGYTEDEIYDYFVERYDVGILRNPPKSGVFMSLWWAPVIGIAIGALVLGTFVTQKKRKKGSSSSGSGSGDAGGSTIDADDDLSEYEARVLDELERDERDRSGRP